MGAIGPRQAELAQSHPLRHLNWWASAAGVLSAVAGVLTGELLAGVASPSLSPVSAVAGAVVDFAPPAAKEWAIQTFGTGDKAFLVTAIAVVLVALGAAAGLLELRRPGFGAALAALIGVVGVVAVATRSLVSALAVACAIAAGIVAAAMIHWLVRRLRTDALEPPPADGAAGWGLSRRRFVRALAGSAAVVALGAVVTAVVRGTSLAASAAREALRLPSPASSAPPIPPDAAVGVDGITPLVTPNRDFYRIDTALVVPSVDPGGWKLDVTGLVDEPVSITWQELVSQPLIERHVTIACVSNTVGGNLIGNARWLGWPVRELLARARPRAGADMVLSRSVDGFTAGTPLEILMDPSVDAMLAIGMNGEPLPAEHGFPVRMIVPGLYGFVSATKWITELKVTTFAADKAYWSTRGWSDHGPIKTASRIDAPRDGARVTAGTVTLGGVAWAQHRGISRVEVKVDNGDWLPARLGTGISRDTWYQWSATVQLSPGRHVATVRAMDGTGALQAEQVAPPPPDGATGYHSITIEAGA
ncbi:molybdopterin-dependent oxidoreductase [Sinomonas sp. JGH33]|uniref:Molybdopterin-dependent oxidoreductase n=1 Tax=Sinomonas terricola TaxID=3110330 RepID=A0ABU5T4N7_9MICC|nr:molybdopterin-dependent oxidoreductase [Sinomonas sp. JGH33]MEA5454568.1 molybdopterin-dependent oxidoreductase [Sinomonas sp. JGH33]